MGSMLKAWMTNISNWHFAISIDSSFSFPLEFCCFFSYNEGFFFLFPVVFIDSWQRIDIDRPQSKGNTLFITRNLLKTDIVVSDRQIQIFSATKAVKIVNIKLMLDSQIFQVR